MKLKPGQGLTVAALGVAVVSLGVAATALLRGGAVVGGDRVVTVDLVKILNGERKALPQLVKQGGGDPSLAMLRIGREIVPTVTAVAGKNTIVLVKQAVVDAHLPDITNQVLDKLGLPKNAPTINLTRGLLQAPTTANAMNGADWARVAREQDQQSAKKYQKARKATVNAQLP